jgi:hypothetical protein
VPLCPLFPLPLEGFGSDDTRARFKRFVEAETSGASKKLSGSTREETTLLLPGYTHSSGFFLPMQEDMADVWSHT